MLIQIKNLKKYFMSPEKGSVVKAVDGVDLDIASGETLGLVGESGSGKTTLGRLILRLYEPDEGTLIVNGTPWTRLTSRALRPLRKNVQVVFQDPYNSLDARWTVYDILKEALLPHLQGKHLSAQEQFARIKEILHEVGLGEEVVFRYPHEFSGGERQRIAIARSLLVEPKLLILDEAVSSLDVLIQAQIVDLLHALQTQKNLTYLFITHNLRVVRKICNRIAVMKSGRLIEIAPTEELFANPLHPYTRELLTAAMDYRPGSQDAGYVISEKSRLIDKGNGHFVIEY